MSVDTVTASASTPGLEERLLVYLSAAILPLYLSMFRYDVGGMYVRAADLALLLLLAGSALSFPRAFERLLDQRFLLLALFTLYTLVQGVWLDNLAASIKEGSQLMLAALWLSLSSYYCERNPELYLKSLITFMAISALYTVAYHFSVGHYINYKLANNGRYAFGFLSLLLLLAAARFQWRLSYLLLFLLSLVLLYCSQERKGMLAVLAVLVVYGGNLLLGAGRLRLLLAIALGLLLAGVLVYAQELLEFYRGLVYRENFLDEAVAIYKSNVHRPSLLINGLQLFVQAPMLGYGADSVYSQMLDFYIDPELANSTHNFYLDNLLKFGALGLGLLLCLPALAVVRSAGWSLDGTLYSMLWLYCLLVVFFMVDGQSSLISFLMPAFMAGLFYQVPDRRR